MYVSRSWKVCDCINSFAVKDGTLTFKAPLGGSVTIVPPKFPTMPHFPFLNRTLIDMSIPDVVAQWVAANLADAPVPHVAVDGMAAMQLQMIVPNFTTPSIVLPQISKPLLKLPKDFGLPVFLLPIGNKTLQKITKLLPDMTALPTLVESKSPKPSLNITLPAISLPEVGATRSAAPVGCCDSAMCEYVDWGWPAAHCTDSNMCSVLLAATAAVGAALHACHTPQQLDGLCAGGQLSAHPADWAPVVNLQHAVLLCSNAQSSYLFILMAHCRAAVQPHLRCHLHSRHMQITIPNLSDWADVLGVPSMPKLPSCVCNMSFQDALTQWVVANQFSVPIPKVTLPDVSVETLKALIPDFSAPALILPNISQTLLKIPKPFPFPVVTIPNDEHTIKAVEVFLPKISTLPLFVAPSTWPDGLPKFPDLSLSSLTIPDIAQVAMEAGAAPHKWFSSPKLNLSSAATPSTPRPSLPVINFTLPAMPTGMDLSFPALKPNLTALAVAVNNLQQQVPDLGIDMSQWPQLLEVWRDKLAPKPLGLNFSAVGDMVKNNPALSGDGNYEVSFEVPNAMAQWIAGVIKKAPIPSIDVHEETLHKLRKILPGLPDLPTLLVVNVSSPYFDSEAVQAKQLPTVVIPDVLVPKVTDILPNLTFVPSLLVPPEQKQRTFAIRLPEITLDKLAAPAFMETVRNMMAGLKSKAGSVAEEQVSVSLAPAPAPATSITIDSSNAAAGETYVAAPQPLPSVPAAEVQQQPMPVQPEPTAVQSVSQPAPDTTAVPAVAATAPADQPVPALTAAVQVTEQQPQPQGQMPVDALATPITMPISTSTGGSSSSSSSTAAPQPMTAETDMDDSDTPESGQPGQSEAALNTDEEGALMLDGPGPETAYMDPKEFYALDNATQQQFLSFFSV